jgi:hypothetical protein
MTGPSSVLYRVGRPGTPRIPAPCQEKPRDIPSIRPSGGKIAVDSTDVRLDDGNFSPSAVKDAATWR